MPLGFACEQIGHCTGTQDVRSDSKDGKPASTKVVSGAHWHCLGWSLVHSVESLDYGRRSLCWVGATGRGVGG